MLIRNNKGQFIKDSNKGGIGYWRNKKRPDIVWNKCTKGLLNVGLNNGIWKGDEVGYVALHAWVKRNLIKPQVCRNCNQLKRLDLANISQQYKRDLLDWEWLCRLCHMRKDGRLQKQMDFFNEFNKNKNCRKRKKEQRANYE